MVQLSLVVNTYNAAARLARTLGSCKGVEEIVIADMSSTDKTLEIARAFNARILNLPYAGYCEPGRQAAIDHACGEWVLLLDADEELGGEIEDVRRVVRSASAGVAAYRIPRPTFIGPQRLEGTGWGVEFERHPRLFRRAEVMWPATVHAVPTFLGRTEELPAGSQIAILHYCFENLHHAYEKINRYTGIEVAERATEQPGEWHRGFSDAVAEFNRRYEPDKDGAVSLGLSMGMWWYRLAVELKAMDLDTTLEDLPTGEMMRRAWAAFQLELNHPEPCLGVDKAQVLVQIKEYEMEIGRLQTQLRAMGEHVDRARQELQELRRSYVDLESLATLRKQQAVNTQVSTDLQAAKELNVRLLAEVTGAQHTIVRLLSRNSVRPAPFGSLLQTTATGGLQALKPLVRRARRMVRLS